MSEEFSDLMGAPDGKAKTYGIVVRAPCRSSFEFDMLARSREAMTSLRAELGCNDEMEFIEDEPDAIVTPQRAAVTMDETQSELRDNADAILTALASLWSHRVAIARATGNKTAYLAACAAEGITPF